MPGGLGVGVIDFDKSFPGGEFQARPHPGWVSRCWRWVPDFDNCLRGGYFSAPPDSGVGWPVLAMVVLTMVWLGIFADAARFGGGLVGVSVGILGFDNPLLSGCS